MVICLERDADLHTVQLMPLPLTVTSVKSRLVFPFWYRLTRVVPERAVKRVLLTGCVSSAKTRNIDIDSFVIVVLSPDL